MPQKKKKSLFSLFQDPYMKDKKFKKYLKEEAFKKKVFKQYENLERQADYETLIKFANYFNVTIDYLLGRTNDK